MTEPTERIHHRVTWEPLADSSEIIRSSVGGYPILPTGESWPVCTEGGCNRKLSFFFQFEVAPSFGLSFEPGSTLSVFQCHDHDDPFEDLDSKFPTEPHDRLPDNYWQHANYAIFFSSPDRQRQLNEREPLLTYSRLAFSPEPEPGENSREALNYRNIKIGGSPFWIQEPKIWNCSCGSEMEFVCSVPENLQYPRIEGSPKQPNGWASCYFLFLGLSTYIFACKRRCHPKAVVAVRQN
jgi:hypothetical protein